MRNDDEIRALLSRLSRRHPSGGTVIERAAIMAEHGRCVGGHIVHVGPA
jgi:hypothetical protein